MNTRRSDVLNRSCKRFVVDPLAIGIVPRWRKRLMQGQPFLRLLDTIVVKFVVGLARLKRREKITADTFRKLAGINGHASDRHTLFVVQTWAGDKRAKKERMSDAL